MRSVARLDLALKERARGRRVGVGQVGVDRLGVHHQGLGLLPGRGRRRVTLERGQHRYRAGDEDEDGQPDRGAPKS